MAEEFDREHGENPLLDLQSYQDLQSRALAAKIQLSSRPRTAIVHSYNGKSVKVELTREDSKNAPGISIEKCKTICEMVMQEAKLAWEEIDKVLLVGGMTRMPMVREMIAELSSAAAGRRRESGRSGGDRRGHPGDSRHARGRAEALARKCCRTIRASNFPPAKARSSR